MPMVIEMEHSGSSTEGILCQEQFQAPVRLRRKARKQMTKTNDPEGDHILTFEQRLIELEREWMSKPTAELPPGSDLGSTELDGSFNVGSGILIQSMNLSSKDVWDSKGAIIRL